MGGWMDVKAVLTIAYSNQKMFVENLQWRQLQIVLCITNYIFCYFRPQKGAIEIEGVVYLCNRPSICELCRIDPYKSDKQMSDRIGLSKQNCHMTLTALYASHPK